MQLKIKFLLLVLLAAPLVVSQVFAQEGAPGNTPELQELNSHVELNLNDDKTLIMDVEVKPTKAIPTAKESTPAVSTINNKKVEPQNKPVVAPSKTDEDLLNFNFLYFIIQKFKISDIVDKE
ncbi:MAG: hypothetical protein JST48_11280 [Bacteroidetes bacterium]|nr:hypothetical protein [Bacteroidota bacterium]